MPLSVPQPPALGGTGNPKETLGLPGELLPPLDRDVSRFDRAGQGRSSDRRLPRRGKIDHAATLRRSYDLINAGDIDDFVEHEQTPGIPATKAGVEEFFRMYTAAFPDLRFVPEDVLASGDEASRECG